MISKTMIVQKNVPIIINAFSSDFSLTETGGIIARIKNKKNKETTTNGIHATPQVTGPNGVIHS